MKENLHTKYGTAKLQKYGYYVITSRKEGNHKKLLHRLIAADYFGEWINEPEDFFDIHHIDGDKTNNCVLNLEPMPKGEHHRLHNTGKNHSEESKQKISKSRNTTGYLNVSKLKNRRCTQGFTWRYQYTENGKHKHITSVSLDKLEWKVKARNLPWRKL